MIEVEGKITNQTIAILIYSREIHSHISPNLVEIFNFEISKHEKSWLVQLATRTKRKINDIFKYFPLDMNGPSIVEDLNIIQLGSYSYWNGLVGCA
jgi:hypothetical protein